MNFSEILQVRTPNAIRILRVGAQTSVFTGTPARLSDFSTLGFGSRKHNPAPSSNPPPKTLNGTVIPPVSCFSQPNAALPAQPPTFPNAFTIPITAPSTFRGSVSAGIAQNGASPANGPGIAKQRN